MAENNLRRADGLPPAMMRLVRELSRLPGVGEKTASRLAFNLLNRPRDEVIALAEALLEMKERVGLCSECFALADAPRCRICEDTEREHDVICVVEGPADLESAIEAARVHDPKVLVEAAVDGIEVECAVLEGIDGGPPEASLPGQVVVDPASSFYDFQAKYLAAGTTMRIPAPIPAAAAAEVRRLACAAFDAISCEGLARVDFFYTPAGQVVFNEINTMPGMTPASGFPMMWASTGLPLPQLIDRIIQTALRKRLGPRLRAAGRRRTVPDGGGRRPGQVPRCRPPTMPTCCDSYLLPGLSPLTRALKSAPGRNFGTELLGTSMVAPVAGLRAVRAGRSLFSKTPNPVMATLSPAATADWMASSTAFTASVADFLSPNRPEIASIRSRLFMFTPAVPPQVA